MMEIDDFIIKIIKEAGDVLLKNYRGSYAKTIKHGDFQDIVTAVDLEINKFLTKEINKNFPKQDVYSEESDNPVKNGEDLWVLDPIDGTANFSRRIPHFAISVGLLKNGYPVTGAVYNPVSRELFSFRKGEGAFLNGQKMAVSSVSELSQAGVFMTTGKNPASRDWGVGVYRNLLDKVNKTRVFSSSALDLCFLADGRIEGVIYGGLTTMDIAAAVGILMEAGGKITDQEGKPAEISAVPQRIIASNGTPIHELLLKEIVA